MTNYKIDFTPAENFIHPNELMKDAALLAAVHKSEEDRQARADAGRAFIADLSPETAAYYHEEMEKYKVEREGYEEATKHLKPEDFRMKPTSRFEQLQDYLYPTR